MSKLPFSEIKNMLKKCNIGYDHASSLNTPYVGFYHAHNWDHGYDAYYGYNGSRREFYNDLSTSVKCLVDYLSCYDWTYAISSPLFNEKTFVYRSRCNDKNMDIILEIKDFLKSHNVSERTKCGIVITPAEVDKIAMIIEGAFRGASKLCLFFPEIGIVITASHHFEIAILTSNSEKEKNVLSRIIKKYPDLFLVNHSQSFNDDTI